MRAPDQLFDPDELLYRRLSTKDIAADGGVLPESLRFHQSSFDRGKYLAEPRDVLTHGSNPAENGFAAILVRDLPSKLDRGADVAPLITYPHDDPLPENDAHCEVRVRRDGADFDPRLKVGPEHKRSIKLAIAAKLRVIVDPT